MRAALAGVLALSAAATMVLRAAPAAAQNARCDRPCLESLADLYVAAVVAHDPSRLPLAATVKFTENGQRLQLGDGLWNTAAAAGGYALHIADVERGQSVLMGTIREADAAWVRAGARGNRPSRATPAKNRDRLLFRRRAMDSRTGSPKK